MTVPDTIKYKEVNDNIACDGLAFGGLTLMEKVRGASPVASSFSLRWSQ